MYIQTDDYGFSNISANFKNSHLPRWPLQTAFLSKHFQYSDSTASNWRGGRSTHHAHSIWFSGPMPDLLPVAWSLLTRCLDSEGDSDPSSRDMNYQSNRLHNTRHILLLQETRCIHNTKERVVGICPTLIYLIQVKPIALLDLIDNLEDMLVNCGKWERTSVWGLT